jgi:phosphonate transport system substrate-binding protein
MKLRFTSCQAPNAEDHVRQVVNQLAKHIAGVEFEYVDGRNWVEREKALFAGDIHVGWICGLPYVIESGKQDSSIELLAAPVMRGKRYSGNPVYFSDVIVKTASTVNQFSDLLGKTWAYNEPHSHSGYNLTRFMLATKKLDGNFFGRTIEAGSHERALRLLLRGTIDATALDSTVLETELRRNPGLTNDIRVLESWGPSPIPPWVVNCNVDKKVIADLRSAITSLHTTSQGEELLSEAEIQKFTEVQDNDYDEIRRMYLAAQRVTLYKKASG